MTTPADDGGLLTPAWARAEASAGGTGVPGQLAGTGNQATGATGGLGTGSRSTGTTGGGPAEATTSDGSTPAQPDAPASPTSLLPSVSLPKGGGAIRGLDEKFSVNAATGTGSMAVQLPLSPGRSGFTPPLRLSYDSGSGNGPLGFGWSLGVPAITRKTDKGLPAVTATATSRMSTSSPAPKTWCRCSTRPAAG